MTLSGGQPIRLAKEIPAWLNHILKGAKFGVATLRQALEARAARETDGLNRSPGGT